MAQLELSEVAQHWVNVVLIWVGFGTVAGLLTRALLPGHEPEGSMGTVVIGIVGSVVGPLVLTSVLKSTQFNPISPLGFLVAIGGALVLLVGYRLLFAVVGSRETDEDL